VVFGQIGVLEADEVKLGVSAGLEGLVGFAGRPESSELAESECHDNGESGPRTEQT
jgi:hypothetical protein